MDFYRYQTKHEVFIVINQLKQKKVDIVESDHTYRINGVFDIFKVALMIYDFEIKRLKIFESKKELLEYADYCIAKYKARNIEESRNILPNCDEEQYARDRLKINTVAEDYAITNAVKGKDDMYFVFVDGRVKIGRSRDYKKRFAQMSTAFPSKYFGYIFLQLGECEKRMHKVFEDYSIKGEWFEDNDRIRRFCQIEHKNVVKLLHNPVTIYKFTQSIAFLLKMV